VKKLAEQYVNKKIYCILLRNYRFSTTRRNNYALKTFYYRFIINHLTFFKLFKIYGNINIKSLLRFIDIYTD